MRKTVLFLSLALMSGMSATARSLSPAEALGRVTNQPALRSSRASAQTPVMTVGTADAPSLYVFNRPEGGWMIVAADDVAAPVIGYSDSGAIDPANLPENMKGWLDDCSRQILAASADGAGPYLASETPDREEIAPMVKTTWDQGAPYNRLCPTVSGRATYTGCVATAMAQVMKFFNWPAQAGANANFSYKWRGGPADTPTLSADFSNFSFDWNNMLDSYFTAYNSAQSDAVANLMKACGYSVEMGYSPVASAAFNEVVGRALVTYFDYDGGLHNEPRELYTSARWEQMVYENLRDCGPMVYWGSGSVGHCFVCDGYRPDGYFHFNWGWSGNSDGYFLLDALNPSFVGTGGGTGGYNNAQGALFGAKPSDGLRPEPVYTFTCSSFSDLKVQGTYLTIQGIFKNRSPYKVNGNAVYMIYSEDGSKHVATVDDFFTPSSFTDFGPELDQVTLMGSISNSVLGEGTYRIYPGIRVDGKEYVFRTPVSEADYIIYTRTKTGTNQYQNTATVPSVGEKVIENLSTNGDLFVSSQFKVSGTARFTGEAETSLYLLAALLDDEGKVLVTAEGANITFTPEGKPFEFISSWFRTTVKPGDYTFALVYMDDITYEYRIVASCKTTVSPYVYGEYKINSFEVDNPAAVDPAAVHMTATVSGLGGIAQDKLYFEIKDAAGNTVTRLMKDLYVSAGNTVTLNATLSIPDAVAGEAYTANVCYERYSFPGGMKPVYDLPDVPITIGDTSGIPGIGADVNAKVEYFNLRGLRVDAADLVPGIYIRRQGSKVSKVIVK